ncbi:MAG: hypothetical protein LLF95_11160 [Bacteroidales bacterium]|nr:hypothetical protein [Bacteroidales bacterium]
MEVKNCESCFTEMQHKVDSMVNSAKNAILKMNHDHTVSIEEREKKSDEFFEKQERKYGDFLDKSDKRENRRFGYNSIILLLFASVIGYSYLRQNEFESELVKKADKTEITSKIEFELITNQGDDYNKNMFVKKQKISADTFSYPSSKRRVFENATRGINANNKVVKN